MKETFSAWSVLGLHNEGKQFSGWLSELRAAAMTSEKLVAEAEDSSGTQRKGECPASRYQATASKDREDFVCAVVSVVFGVCNSVRLP